MDEVKFEPFQKVLVRDDNTAPWDITFFKYLNKNSKYKFSGFNGCWKQCLPYEGNEHLFGTTASPTPPESPLKWGDKVVVQESEEYPWRKGIFVGKTPSGEIYVVCYGEDVATRYKHCRRADW